MSLHAFPLGRREGILDLSLWNSASLWRSDYGSLAHGCLFFAEDAFGVQFCFKNERVQTFDPETGQTQEFATSLGDWATRILEDYQVHTGYPLAHEWQKTHRRLKEGERLLPKMPFILRGAYALDNLYVLDSVKGMKYRASIAKQLRDVPDGSKVKIRISQ
jgi:hypothetical protein